MAFRKKAYRKKARGYARRPGPRRYARKGGKRPALKKMIRREISRQVENKTIQQTVISRIFVPANGATFETATGSVGNMLNLGPTSTFLAIAQGTGQGQRVGNCIRTKRLTIKGTFVPYGYEATYNPTPEPMQIKMWVFYDKTTPTTQPTPYLDFFQSGNTTTGFQNDLVDLWMPVNTDKYRVLTTRTFKLGYGNYNGTGYQNAYQTFANNDFKMNASFSIDLTKYYPKNVRFNDSAGTPTTRGLYCIFAPCRASGGAWNGLERLGQLQYSQSYVYEDA